MRYRLRTLLIVLALGPPVLAGAIVTLPVWPLFLIWLIVILTVLAIAMYLEKASHLN